MTLCSGGQDLGKELASELSGNFKTLCVETLLGPAEFDAKQINKAVKVRTAYTRTPSRSAWRGRWEGGGGAGCVCSSVGRASEFKSEDCGFDPLLRPAEFDTKQINKAVKVRTGSRV